MPCSSTIERGSRQEVICKLIKAETGVPYVIGMSLETKLLQEGTYDLLITQARTRSLKLIGLDAPAPGRAVFQTMIWELLPFSGKPL